jgi:hypothetical protein
VFSRVLKLLKVLRSIKLGQMIAVKKPLNGKNVLLITLMMEVEERRPRHQQTPGVVEVVEEQVIRAVAGMIPVLVEAQYNQEEK